MLVFVAHLVSKELAFYWEGEPTQMPAIGSMYVKKYGLDFLLLLGEGMEGNLLLHYSSPGLPNMFIFL